MKKNALNETFQIIARKIFLLTMVLVFIILLSGVVNSSVGQYNSHDYRICTSRQGIEYERSKLIDHHPELFNYSIEDLRQLIASGERIYQNIRIQSDDDGTRTHSVPVSYCEIASVIGIENHTTSDVQPLNANTPYVRIRTSLRPDGTRRPNSDSIVIILMGDGFTARNNNVNICQQGRWPNPRAGTVVWHADRAITALEQTYPFNLFTHLLTVYVIQVATPAGQAGRLGSVDALGTLSTNINSSRIRGYADSRVPRSEQTMLQVISNARAGSGFAFMTWHYSLVVDISVTSLRTDTAGGHNAVWLRDFSDGVPAAYNGTAWHGTFIHEFGHSFGQLVDNHHNSVGYDDRRANVQGSNVEDNLKWQHWLGHRNVALTPQSIGYHSHGKAIIEWFVPSVFTTNANDQVNGGYCIMVASWANRNFNGVSRAELTRRMALISGETFRGRSPSTSNQIPNNAANRYVRINNNQMNRILDSAFHGNTVLHTLTIPASISTIGDFAFLGATGLRVINNMNVTPQPINDTTFANSGTSNGQPNQLNRALITVHIPQGTYHAYRAAGWSGFNLIEVSIQGSNWMETGSLITLSLPNGIETSNIQWSIQSGNGTLVVLNNGRTARLSSSVVGTIQVRVDIEGVIIFHTVTVALRPPCTCINHPGIINLCCCAIRGEPCVAFNNPWSLGCDACCSVMFYTTSNKRCC